MSINKLYLDYVSQISSLAIGEMPQDTRLYLHVESKSVSYTLAYSRHRDSQHL